MNQSPEAAIMHQEEGTKAATKAQRRPSGTKRREPRREPRPRGGHQAPKRGQAPKGGNQGPEAAIRHRSKARPKIAQGTEPKARETTGDNDASPRNRLGNGTKGQGDNGA